MVNNFQIIVNESKMTEFFLSKIRWQEEEEN